MQNKAGSEKEASISKGMRSKDKEESASKKGRDMADDRSVNLSAKNSRSGYGSNIGRGDGKSEKNKNLKKFINQLEDSVAVSQGRTKSGHMPGSKPDFDDSKSVKSQINETKMKKRITEQFPNLDAFENESGKSEINEVQAALTQQRKIDQYVDGDRVKMMHNKKAGEHLDSQTYASGTQKYYTYHTLILIMMGICLMEVFRAFLREE